MATQEKPGKSFYCNKYIFKPTALFLQRLMKYYSEQILILQGIMSLKLITVYYLQNTTYTIRKCTIKLVILLNLC